MSCIYIRILAFHTPPKKLKDLTLCAIILIIMVCCQKRNYKKILIKNLTAGGISGMVAIKVCRNCFTLEIFIDSCLAVEGLQYPSTAFIFAILLLPKQPLPSVPPPPQADGGE